MSERETEMDVVARIAAALEGFETPADCAVVIFVFRDEPETTRLRSAYISEAKLPRLRRWMRAWLRETAPKTAETTH